MTEINHNNLPEAVTELHKKFDILISFLQAGNKIEKEVDRLFNLKELKEYLPEHPAEQTIYGKVCMRQIPYEKHGGRLYFRKSAIDAWLANGREM